MKDSIDVRPDVRPLTAGLCLTAKDRDSCVTALSPFVLQKANYSMQVIIEAIGVFSEK